MKKPLSTSIRVLAIIAVLAWSLSMYRQYRNLQPKLSETQVTETQLSTSEKLYSEQPTELLDVVSKDEILVKPQESKRQIRPVSIAADQSVKLGKRNTIVFNAVVDDISVAKAQQELINMSHSLAPSDKIYLVLNTPGGSVDAGNLLIDTARSLPQEVKTITIFAASMGFHIVENLGERLVMPSSTLMSHRVTIGGIGGQVPGEAVTRMNFIIRESREMDAVIAKRVGMDLDAYEDLIRNEYWVKGEDSIQDRMADKIVKVQCGEDMMGSHTEHMKVLIFDLDVTWSDCPLITAPLAIAQDSRGYDSNHATTEEITIKKAQIRNFITTLFYNKEQFVRDYIITGKYQEFTGK